MSDSPPGHPHVRFERLGDRDVVIKRGDRGKLRREAQALNLLGDNAVDVIDLIDIDLIDWGTDSAELITQRVLPGDDLRPLARIDDDAATEVIAVLIRAMRAAQGAGTATASSLPELHGVLEPIERCRDPRLHRSLIDAARRVGLELIQSGDPIALHGDLQHRNIARGRDDDTGVDNWKVIDPHGWWGDSDFESVAMLVAPESLLMGSPVIDARGMSSAPLVALTNRRIQIIAEVTGDDPDRLRAWAFVGAVIAEARMLAQHDLVHGAPLALAQALLRS